MSIRYRFIYLLYLRILKELPSADFRMNSESIVFTFSEYFKTLEMPDSWKRASAKPMCKKNKHDDHPDYRIVRIVLISDKMTEYALVNLIHNKFKDFN